MKNVHLIPTDKGQRITKTNNGTFLFCSEVGKDFIEIRKGYSGFHLYITSSNEEIKEGDYVIEDIGGVVYGPIDRESIVENPKKIILTTDLELINDGVQPIDNEFLEWFVKNPSCESVEVVKGFVDGSNYGYNFLDYKIIIPKEEPKQETLEEAACTALGYEYDYWLSMHSKDQSSLIYTEVTNWCKGAKWQQEQEKNKYNLKINENPLIRIG
jgi:hypothetical protein